MNFVSAGDQLQFLSLKLPVRIDDLIVGKTRRAPKASSLPACLLHSGNCSLAYQAALELCKGSHDMEYKAASGCRGIDFFRQRLKLHPLFSDALHKLHKAGQGAA